MSTWYDLQVSMQEHYKDLAREADEKARARMVPGQRRQLRSLLQTLTRQVSRATVSAVRAEGSPHAA